MYPSLNRSSRNLSVQNNAVTISVTLNRVYRQICYFAYIILQKIRVLHILLANIKMWTYMFIKGYSHLPSYFLRSNSFHQLIKNKSNLLTFPQLKLVNSLSITQLVLVTFPVNQSEKKNHKKKLPSQKL